MALHRREPHLADIELVLRGYIRHCEESNNTNLKFLAMRMAELYGFEVQIPKNIVTGKDENQNKKCINLHFQHYQWLIPSG